MAMATYKEMLADELSILNDEQETMLYAQHALIKSEHKEVIILQDMLAESK